MLRYAKERWGDLDACSYHVLTTVELPDDVAVAKQILRRLEAAFIESALAREEPLQNKNEPLCKCEKTRRYQAEWRTRVILSVHVRLQFGTTVHRHRHALAVIAYAQLISNCELQRS